MRGHAPKSSRSSCYTYDLIYPPAVVSYPVVLQHHSKFPRRGREIRTTFLGRHPLMLSFYRLFSGPFSSSSQYSFWEPGVEPEVQRMRHEAYSQRRHEMMRLCRQERKRLVNAEQKVNANPLHRVKTVILSNCTRAGACCVLTPRRASHDFVWVVRKIWTPQNRQQPSSTDPCCVQNSAEAAQHTARTPYPPRKLNAQGFKPALC